MLIFDPATGLVAEDADQVRQTVQQDWKLALGTNLDVDASTPAGQLIDSETAIIVDKDSQVLEISNQFDPEKNDGIWQDAIGHIYFMNRQVATSSLVDCDCVGLTGTVIPVGAIVSTQDKVTLKALGGGTIPISGVISLQFATEITGPIIIADNTVNRIVTVIPGWDTVNNPLAGTIGRTVEGRADFEKRRNESVAANAHGSLEAISGVLLNISGVLDAYTIENNGPLPIVKQGVTIKGHSIFAAIKGGLDTDIAFAIYSKKDAGCDTTGNTVVSYIDPVYGVEYPFNIERPIDLSFGIKVSLRLTADTPASIEQDLKDAILADFQGLLPDSSRVGIGDIVQAAQFYCISFDVGAHGLKTIEVSAPYPASPWVDEIIMDANQYPILLEENIIIEILP